MNSVKEIKQNSVEEIVISKSKFFAYSFAVHNLDETKQILADLQSKHKDSTHICYAYIVGGLEKCSDDGEPQGTAGKPILDCIKKSGFQNVLIAVVRYFGGIKLGAGGLVRAYSNSASKVLNASGEKLTYECKKLGICLDLSETKFIEKIRQIESVKDIKIEYSQQIMIDIFCFEQDTMETQNKVENLLNRKVDFTVFAEKFYV